MSLPVFAAGQPLSAGAVNRLDEAIDALADRAMSFAVPQLVVQAGYEAGKRGYVIHRHNASTHEVEALIYDLLIAGVGSGKSVQVKYAGTLLYEFDGSDAAHGDGHQQGYWLLHDFPTEGTHPADGAWVEVDVIVAGGAGPTADIYALREGLLSPDIYVGMIDAGGDALTDDQDVQVPIDLQTVATNVLALQGLSHGRVAGFCPQTLGDVVGAPRTVGVWRWPTNKGDLLYYSLRVFKENEGNRGGAKVATVKIYMRTQAVPESNTLVGTFYAGYRSNSGGDYGDKYDVLGGGRGDRFHEGVLDISGVTRYQNEPCIVFVTLEYDGGDADGYSNCTVYMLREECAAVPGINAFAGAEYGAYVEGYPGLPPLRELWNGAGKLAGDSGDGVNAGYGTDGYDETTGFPHGYALLWYGNPVMFGGPQQNQDLSALATEARFIRTADVLYFAVKGDAELFYTDVDGAEATRQLDERTDDDPYWTMELSDIDGLPYGASFGVRRVNGGGEPGMIYGAWMGDAE